MNESNYDIKSDEAAIFEGLRNCVETFAEVNGQYEDGKIPEITPSSHLENDLGFDSLERVDLIIFIEGEFGVELGNNMNEFKTVDDVFKHLKDAVSKSREC